MNEKENFLNFYTQTPFDHIPSEGVGEVSVYPVNGFEERPPHDQGGIDWFGCTWVYMEDSASAAPDCRVPRVLDDICDWEEVVKFPDLDAWDWDRAVEQDHINEIDRENNAVNQVVLIGPWERLHVLMGFEDALCAMVEEPEAVGAFMDRMADYKIELIGKLKKYYDPDVIMFHDDWGTQKAPFFAPDIWRELIKPAMKRIIDYTHEQGIIFELHSCGKYDEIIPEIADMGVDTLQCMDINDLPAAIKKTDGKMSFCASVHGQDFVMLDDAGKLDPDYVRETVRNEFDCLCSTGYYMPFLFPPATWYDKIVYEEFERARDKYAGTYAAKMAGNAEPAADAIVC